MKIPATTEELEVIEHIRNRNQQNNEWVNEVTGRWTPIEPISLKYLRENGIENMTRYNRISKENTYNNLHEHIHGTKIPWPEVEGFTEEKLNQRLEKITQAMKEKLQHQNPGTPEVESYLRLAA